MSDEKVKGGGERAKMEKEKAQGKKKRDKARARVGYIRTYSAYI